MPLLLQQGCPYFQVMDRRPYANPLLGSESANTGCGKHNGKRDESSGPGKTEPHEREIIRKHYVSCRSDMYMGEVYGAGQRFWGLAEERGDERNK